MALPFDAIPAGHRIAERYEVERRLGRGRSAVVYRAQDLRTRTRVALKVLDPFEARDPVAAARFAREIEILGRVTHPNVIRVHSLLREGEWWILVMEHFDSTDLKAQLDRSGPLPVQEIVALARTLASALDACHRAKVVHRDLKPQNVLRSAAGEVKVVDFGIALLAGLPELTRTGTILGTPGYLAPELLRSGRADPRADLYALGAVLYECATGRPPYRAGSLAAAMALQERGDVEPIAAVRADVPPWLEAIVRKCLRADPGRRHPTCHDLLRDLERGERARCAYEEAQPARHCLRCRGELLAGLPFCPDCGVRRELAPKRGGFLVVLERCADPERLERDLERTCGVAPSARLRRGVRRPPAVLFGGVSRETAEVLAEQLAHSASELRIRRWLAGSLDLPLTHVALAGALLAPLFWLADVASALSRALLVLAAELGVGAAYWRRTRPLVPLSGLRRGIAEAPREDASLRAEIAALTALRQPALKSLLAEIVRSGLELRAALRKRRATGDAVGPEAVAALVRGALAAAGRVEEYEAFLARASAAELRARLDALAHRLDAAAALRDLEPLVAEKARVLRDLRDLSEVEDRHAATMLSIVNAKAVLGRIEGGVADPGEIEALGRELLAGSGDGDDGSGDLEVRFDLGLEAPDLAVQPRGGGGR